MRPLLVGQAPGPKSDPAEPLSGRCGARLAALCGLELDQFLRAFERVNLVERFHGKAGKGDVFNLIRARRKAIKLLVEGTATNRRVVLLGDGVARAFSVENYELLKWRHTAALSYAVAPHPSGVNHWFNDPDNVDAARAFWRDLAADR